ncbi:UNVERIFIED_CONTAM: hypothetical protein FKN15_001701 [Acipenser sinensis]
MGWWRQKCGDSLQNNGGLVPSPFLQLCTTNTIREPQKQQLVLSQRHNARLRRGENTTSCSTCLS